MSREYIRRDHLDGSPGAIGRHVKQEGSIPNVDDHVLYIGWLDYCRAVSALPLETQAFQVWYYAMYPEKLNPDGGYEEVIQIFGADLRTVPRTEAKRRLRVVIEHYRGRQELMEHPSTENRPLDLEPIG